MNILHEPYLMLKNRLYGALAVEHGESLDSNNHRLWTLADRIVTRVRYAVREKDLDHMSLMKAMLRTVFKIEYEEVHGVSSIADMRQHYYANIEAGLWADMMTDMVVREFGEEMKSHCLWVE